jgi:hypothetical protein
VEDLASERVDHAHRTLAYRAHDRVLYAAAVDELADQHALVNEIDRCAIEDQLATV